MSELMLIGFLLVFNLAIIFPYFMFLERKKKQLSVLLLLCFVKYSLWAVLAVLPTAVIIFFPLRTLVSFNIN